MTYNQVKGSAEYIMAQTRRLREKIEDNPSEPHYVMTKWGVGYYFNA